MCIGGKLSCKMRLFIHFSFLNGFYARWNLHLECEKEKNPFFTIDYIFMLA